MSNNAPANPSHRDWFIPEHNVTFFDGRSGPRAVVIPVVNEGPRFAALLDRMFALRIHALADIIVVDGASTDGSVETEKLRAKKVAGLLTYQGAEGLSAQLQIAYAHCLLSGYSSIVTIDGNNKDDPDAIPLIFGKLESGVDFVQGSRFIPGGSHQNTPIERLLAVRLIHAPILSISSGFCWTDTTQGFRGYTSRLLEDKGLDIFRDVFRSYGLLVYLSARAPRLGFTVKEIGTSRNYPEGKVPTKINGLRNRLSLLIDLIRAASGRYDSPHPNTRT